METKFQSIVDNWINGNRKDCRASFESLTGNENYQFQTWLKDQYYDSAVPDEYFKMVLFLLCA